MVKLTRRVSFSSGHRYWLKSKSEAENRALFGRWASPFSHGHNYVLDVTTEGVIDPVTGMVVNIKDIDDVLQETIVGRFDGKSMNDEIAWFADHAPSVENILLYCKETLSGGVFGPDAKLTGLKLEETPTLHGELILEGNDWKMTLTRTYEFAASHRLHTDALTPAQNVELFGKCNNPSGHGHNYLLEVTVEGKPDAEKGMLTDLGALDEAVEKLIVDRYDHKNLSVDLPEFKGKNATSEVIVQQIFEVLDGKLPAKLKRVRLHETARNIFEVEAR